MNKRIPNPRQRYAIYRDNDLIASDLPSLPAILKFVRNDARRDQAQGRPARYLITGSRGFRRTGSHSNGRMIWEGQMSDPPTAPAGSYPGGGARGWNKTCAPAHPSGDWRATSKTD